MRKIKKTSNQPTKEEITLSLILIILSITAILIITHPKPYNGFQPLQIQLTSYPTKATQGKTNFTLLINDSRTNETYIATIYVNQNKQYTTNLKNGSNQLQVNLQKKGLQKITISIYNPTNEYNGYGCKTQPFTLSFMAEVK